MNVVLYSTKPPCPKCRVLEQKLDEAKIKYQIVDDIETIKSQGYGGYFMPLLKVDENVLEFRDAIIWANNKI